MNKKIPDVSSDNWIGLVQLRKKIKILFYSKQFFLYSENFKHFRIFFVLQGLLHKIKIQKNLYPDE